MTTKRDVTLPEGPRYGMVGYVAVGYRRRPCFTTRQRVDPGDILPAASGVATPSLTVRGIVGTQAPSHFRLDCLSRGQALAADFKRRLLWCELC